MIHLICCGRSCINDAFISDVTLLWPPHIVAVAAISIAAIQKHVDLRQWQASLHCDTQQVASVMSSMVDMYETIGDNNFQKDVSEALSACDTYFAAK